MSTIISTFLRFLIICILFLVHNIQVGFVMLTLPYSVSQMGLGFGISGILFYGALGAWAVYLLTVLYEEHNARSFVKETKTYPEKHILQV